MKLPYRPYRVSLFQGEPYETVWRPIVPLLLHGPLGRVKINALVDCGADQTMFPRQLANAIGIDVDESRPGSVRGIAGGAMLVHPGELKLEIARGQASFIWTTTARFGPGNHTLLGQLGFLEYFVATLDHRARFVMLEPNDAYPGTVRV